MIEVELPDGSIAEIDTDDPNVAAAAAKKFLQNRNAPVAEPLASPQSAVQPPAQVNVPAGPENAPAATGTPVEASSPSVPPMSMADRFLQGIKDVSLGTEQLAHRLVPLFPGRSSEVDRRINELNAQYRAPDGMDWARLAGSAAATLPLGAIGGGVPGLLAGGALAGATTPVIGEEAQANFGSEKLGQAALGAATSGLVGGALGAVGRVLAPKVADDVRLLMGQGVTPTPGQILGGRLGAVEEKMQSWPLTGDLISMARGAAQKDFNRATMAKVLEPIGEAPPKELGREGIAQVREKLRAAYDDIVPKLGLTATDDFSAALERAITAGTERLTPDQGKVFLDRVRSGVLKRIGPEGSISGEKLQGMISDLRDVGRGLSTDSSFENREIGQALRGVQDVISSSLKAQNPEYAGRLSAVDEAYSRYATLRNASTALGSQGGEVTGAALLRSVKNADKTRGKDRFAAGQAGMQDWAEAGKSVLGGTVPDSGTAGRLAMGAMLGGSAFIDPTVLATSALLSVPYLPGARKAMAALMTKRPEAAQSARGLLGLANPYLSVAGVKARDEGAR